MFGKSWTVLIVLFLVGLLLLPLVAATQAEPQVTAATVIVVDSGKDINSSKSETCATATPCTLRRAIVQARLVLEVDRPVAINFNVPMDAAEGYKSGLGVWELEILTTTDTSVFRTLEGGQITIDGTTQPGGRTSGPKIILVGPGTGNKDGIKVGANPAGNHDDNVIRGLGFQNFKTHLFVSSNRNLIENNWFGLTSDGQEAYLRNDDPEDGSGSGGIWFSAGVEENLVSGNVFLGFDGTAVSVRGNGNEFSGNYVGTDAGGKVPGKQTDPNLICTKVDWLGGGGVTMEGDMHEVKNNIFAGLRQEIFHGSTQPDAVSLTGKDHVIMDNGIGVDKDGTAVGVCGRGVYLHGSPEGVNVESNRIVDPGLSGISLNGVLADANTFRSNVIANRFQWPEDDINPEPEDAIQLGPSLSDDFRNFKPARVMSIEGKTVMGTHGVGSPCSKCVVELFLDDKDGIKEALQSLAVVTADDDGNWTALIPSELADDERIRTTSTSGKFNTIPLKDVGTTTGLSGLYGQEGLMIYLPVVIGE